jgi:uncharacterized protein YndB with AHSA1/START domain
MPREFKLQKEITLDATPDQVWEAIATGPGYDAWFMGRNEIEPREGGTVRMTIGGQTEESTVSAWEPGKRISVRTPETPDGRFMAFEYLIEARAGGSTTLKVVHSGFLGDDWEAEYDALNEGWDMYLDQLAQYLTFFEGRAATPVSAFQPQGNPDREQTMSRYRTGLGLGGPVAKGDEVRLTPEGLDPIDGVVDYLSPSFLGVRSADGLYRFIFGYNGTAVVGHHLYSASADEEQATRDWQAWMTKVFG